LRLVVADNVIFVSGFLIYAPAVGSGCVAAASFSPANAALAAVALAALRGAEQRRLRRRLPRVLPAAVGVRAAGRVRPPGRRGGLPDALQGRRPSPLARPAAGLTAS
jgi:hypothetical protein